MYHSAQRLIPSIGSGLANRFGCTRAICYSARIMKIVREISWELVLIVGSILMFRGGWTLLDRFAFANTIGFLRLTFIIGTLLTVVAYTCLRHQAR